VIATVPPEGVKTVNMKARYGRGATAAATPGTRTGNSTSAWSPGY